MADWLRAAGIELPIVQAGMGGGLAGHALAAAVSDAGGLGTIGFLGPDALATELARARELTKAPLAVNLLLPFATPRHWAAASEADVVVTFWGKPRRRSDRIWMHQVGSVEEAVEARNAGASAVIAQGVEAGGHVRGRLPTLELLERVLAALPAGFPVLAAGGIGDADGVATAIAHGAAGAVLGTRFLLTEESAAHPGYKRALVDARETVLTELFGLGWPAPHRVVPNRATRRWLARDPRGPSAVRAFNHLTAPLARAASDSLQSRLLSAQRPSVPLFSPLAPAAGRPARLVEASPLYAGESVRGIADVRPASALTCELATKL